MMMVDETDIDLVGGGGSSPAKGGTKRAASDGVPVARPPSKRKAGPIPRHVIFRRSPSIPTDSPPPTPPPTPPPITPAMPLVNGDLGEPIFLLLNHSSSLFITQCSKVFYPLVFAKTFRKFIVLVSDLY